MSKRNQPTEREQQVVELVAKGLKNRDIGRVLGISEQCIKNYLRIIYDKLGLWNRVELALWYESRTLEASTYDRKETAVSA